MVAKNGLGPASQTASDSWETLFVNFKAPVDLTNAAYLGCSISC